MIDAPMRLVIVESPFAGDVRRNTEYACAALLDCLHRGEAPFASHLLYARPGVLDDDTSADRELGITAGLAWGRVADVTAVYGDLGVSAGMMRGIEHAYKQGRAVDFRSLAAWREEQETRS